MRLAGNNNNASAGRLEVNYNGQGWGTVCDDLWDLADADVACKMLGFRSATSAPREAYFGEGSGTIWLDDLLCSGNESSLLQCPHAGLGVHNCRHSEDAGVVCSGLCKLWYKIHSVTHSEVAYNYMYVCAECIHVYCG